MIPPEVAQRLGYYVYLYVDPRTDKPFYVGKGQKDRALAHLSARGESRKAQILSELAKIGEQPRIEILAHALPSEETALRIEAAVIDLFGLDDLTNLVVGLRSIQLGRMPAEELYDATRSAWKLGPARPEHETKRAQGKDHDEADVDDNAGLGDDPDCGAGAE